MGNSDSKNHGKSPTKTLIAVNVFPKNDYERYLRELAYFSRQSLKPSAPATRQHLVKCNNVIKMMYRNESKRLNELSKKHGFPDLVDKEDVFEKNEELKESMKNAAETKTKLDKTMEFANVLLTSLEETNEKLKELENNSGLVEKLKEALEKANRKIETLETNIVQLHSKMPMDPEMVRRMKMEMTESLKTFKKQDEKTIGQNFDNFLKKIPQLKKLERTPQSVSEFEKRANLYEYVLNANIRKIKESPYIIPTDLLPIPERPDFNNLGCHLLLPQSDECSICLMGMQKDRDLISFCNSCKQKFHKKCVGEWLNRSAACPLCRNPDELLRSYLET